VERKQHPLRPEFASEKETLFYQMASKTLPIPRTREVLLSEAKNDKERKEAYVALLEDDDLGPQALLMNLAAMDRLGVPRDQVKAALMKAKTERILPLQFFSAFSKAPMYREEINSMMRKALSQYSKLRGTTVMVVDLSGSMHNIISEKGEFRRVDAAKALAVMAREVCDNAIIYATAGNDGTRVHKTVRISDTPRGFDLADAIQKAEMGLGGGGIFTRQALEFIKADLKAQPGDVDRILVFSDSQDCDRVNKVPSPFGKYNYIIDVSANQFGINYKGVWTQEISGWSQHFIEYVAQCEEGYQSSLL
jgi:two-component sensor histidine kinase